MTILRSQWAEELQEVKKEKNLCKPRDQEEILNKLKITRHHLPKMTEEIMIQMKNKMSFSWMSSKASSKPHHF